MEVTSNKFMVSEVPIALLDEKFSRRMKEIQYLNNFIQVCLFCLHNIKRTQKLEKEERMLYDTEVLEVIEKYRKRINKLQEEEDQDEDRKTLLKALTEERQETIGSVVWVWQGRFPNFGHLVQQMDVNPRYTLVGVTGIRNVSS